MTKFHVPEPSYDWDEIVEGVKMAAEECGEPLTGQEYDNWQATSEEDFPTIRWIQRRAAGWKEVCKRVGVQYGRGNKYTDDEVLSAVGRAAADMGEPLTQAEYREWRQNTNENQPSITTTINRFDWEEACEKADVSTVITSIGRSKNYTDDDLLSAIERAAADVGEPLTQAEYREWRQNTDETQPSITTIKSRFDWEEACEKADVSMAVEKSYTDDDLLSAIERAAASTGEPLRQMEYMSWRQNTDETQPSITPIKNRFGWEEACEKAGVSGAIEKGYTDDEVLSAVERAAADMGEPLTQTMYQSWRDNTEGKYPSVNTVKTRLGWKSDRFQAELK
jgi:hypothetical protein